MIQTKNILLKYNIFFMDYILPSSDGFTIYTKSGCPFCTKAKKLLEKENQKILIIDCDDYLLENKADFLQFIQEIAKKEHKTFPIIFDKGEFIGGFTETKVYCEKLSAFSDF